MYLGKTLKYIGQEFSPQKLINSIDVVIFIFTLVKGKLIF